ncbi:hypothetical protein D3C71_874300 [compost metagenome]
MQGDQHDHAGLLRKIGNEAQNFNLPVEIERGGRLVHQQHFRLAGQRLRQRNKLPLAAG